MMSQSLQIGRAFLFLAITTVIAVNCQDEETTTQLIDTEDMTTMFLMDDNESLWDTSESDMNNSSSLEENDLDEMEEDNFVEVQTILGSITGRKEESAYSGDNLYTFKGIPYAQPPINDLRFKPPLPVNAWGALSALEFGNLCPQFDILGFTGKKGYIGDEDCLLLNIYTPYLPQEDNANTTLKPVMVLIHGGGFTIGSGSQYDPEEIVMTQDVVVVTINYRLGLLGFFNMENDIAPGNLGLRDQIEALKWVKRYIQIFGGDGDQVTIFGSSAGGISVHSLMLSPMASGLFKQAIAQSGVILSYGSLTPNIPLLLSNKATAELGCNQSSLFGPDFNGILECLNQFNAEELVMVFRTPDGMSKNIVEENMEDQWRPINDPFSSSAVLPLDSLMAMKYGAFNKVPLMLGTVKNEGALFLDYGGDSNISKSDEEAELRKMSAFINVAHVTTYDDVSDEELGLTRIMKQFYIGNEEESDQGLVDLFTDAWFLSPDQKVAELTSKHISYVFSYQMTHQSEKVSLAPLIYGLPNRTDLHPVHGDENLFLFDLKGLHGENSKDDLLMRKSMIKYWGNFAKYGHPSPFLADNLTPWLPYKENKNYLELKPVPEMKSHLEPERMLLWDKLVWDDRERKLEEQYKILGHLQKFFHEKTLN